MKMKKMLRLLALCLLFTLLPLSPVLAAEGAEPVPTAEEEEPVNLVENGGLETLDEDGNPVGWAFDTHTYWNPASGISEEKPYKGKYSVYQYYDPAVGLNCHGAYAIPVTEGCTYRMTAMRNAATDGATLMVEYYIGATPGETTTFQSSGGTEYFATTNGVWAESAFEFTVPDGINTAILYVSCRKAGYVYWDDLKCVEIARPIFDRYALDADYFYYTDSESGTAYLTHADAHYEIREGDTFELEILDGEEVLYQKSAPAASNVEIRFPVLVLEELCKDYTLKTWYQTAEGENIFSLSQNIFRVDRPSMIDTEGRFIVDGELFTPHTGWTTKSAEYYEVAKRLGCNVGMSAGVYYSTAENNIERYKEKIDDMYYNYGLMVCVTYYMPTFSGHEGYFERLPKMVEALKDHPGIFAWVLMDEPSLHPNECDVDSLVRGYKIVRQHDSMHPVMSVEAIPGWYNNAVKTCDFLVIDPYPSSNTSLPTMFKNYDARAREVLRQNKPLTSIIRAYRETGKFSPDANFIRYSFFEWIRLGTDGIAAYNLAASSDPEDIWNRPGIWDAYTYFSDYEMEDVLKAMARGELPIFFQVQGEEDPVYYYGYVSGDTLHVIVMNRTGENQGFSIPLVSYNGSIKVGGFTATPDPFSGLATIRGSRNLEAELDPYQVIHFEVEPNSAVSLAGLGTTRLYDVAAFGWARDAIEDVVKKGIMEQPRVREFFPGREVTRGEFASALVRALSISGDGETFTDVEELHPYAKDIAKGKAAGILKGYEDGTFHPDDTITRQDLMTICARAMRTVRALDEGEDLAAFTDADAVADYAIADVAALFKAGIVQGNADGTIAPLLSATRAETAVLAQRVMLWKDAL